MDWNDFIDYKIVEIGKRTILMGGVLGACVVLMATWVAIKIARRALLNPRIIINKIDKKRRISIFLIVKYLGWVVSILLALKVLGFDITLIIFGSTAVLIGLGFGLQDIFRDFVSGMFLLFEGSLKIGDVIEADGIVGRVKEINLRSSEVITQDDVTIVIPNSKFVAEKVVNWSMDNELVRFQVEVAVAYGSDVEKVIATLEKVMEENENVADSPKAFVRFTDFGDSALQFQMIFWSKFGFVIDNVKSDIRREVYKKLNENGLVIPYPQRDIHIKGLEKMMSVTKTTEN